MTQILPTYHVNPVSIQSKTKLCILIIIYVDFLQVFWHLTYIDKNENDDLMNYILADESVYNDSLYNDKLIQEMLSITQYTEGF